MVVQKKLLTLLLILMFMPMTAAAGKLEPVGAVPVPVTNPQTPEKIELGKQLFFDRRLSGDGTMSCSTCHDPEKGYSDDLAISLSYPRRGTGGTRRRLSMSASRGSCSMTAALELLRNRRCSR